MGDSLENPDTSVETQNVAVVDYGEFANYILKAASILLPEEDIHVVPPALSAALDEKINQDCIKKFLSDPQIPALYVQRSCSKGKSKNTRCKNVFVCLHVQCALRIALFFSYVYLILFFVYLTFSYSIFDSAVLLYEICAMVRLDSDDVQFVFRIVNLKCMRSCACKNRRRTNENTNTNMKKKKKK